MSESEEDTTSNAADWPVTEEWLQAVLRHHHNDLIDKSSLSTTPANTHITIIDFNVKPGCDAGESVLSDILAVAVKYSIKHDKKQEDDDNSQDVSNCLSFIIKLLPQDPFSRFFVTEAQFDLREIKFYTQIVPDLESFKRRHLPPSTNIPLPIPKCYYAHYNQSNPNSTDPTPPESVLVLENIKPLGYFSADFAHGLTLRQTLAAVYSIARLHALSLSIKIKENYSILEHYPFLFQTTRASDSYQQLVERGLPQLSQFLENCHGFEHILTALNHLRPHTKFIIENLLSPEEPIALITHTDFWCNNLMFKEFDNNDDGNTNNENNCLCAILDWQMVTYSRPTNDLALLLISSLPAELRRLHTEKLLDNYWLHLNQTCQLFQLNIEEQLGYNRKQLGLDYKKSQLLALLLCIGSVDLALGNAQMEERLLALLQDLYNDGLLDVDIIKN